MKIIITLLVISVFAGLSETLHADPEHKKPEGTVEVSPLIKKFEFPIDDDLKSKLLAMTKRYNCTLKELFLRYGVTFLDGSTVSMDESRKLISGTTDHQNGFYIMLLLAQISGEEMSKLIQPESADCEFSPPSINKTKGGEVADGKKPEATQSSH